MICQLWWADTALVVVLTGTPRRKDVEAALQCAARARGATGAVSWSTARASAANPAMAHVDQVRTLEVQAGPADLPPGVDVFDRPFPDPHVGEPALLWTGPETPPVPVVVLTGDPVSGYETQPTCTTGCRVPHSCLFPVASADLLQRASALVGSP